MLETLIHDLRYAFRDAGVSIPDYHDRRGLRTLADSARYTETNPLSLAAVVLVLAATAMAACRFPARRAARTAPVEALRYE